MGEQKAEKVLYKIEGGGDRKYILSAKGKESAGALFISEVFDIKQPESKNREGTNWNKWFRYYDSISIVELECLKEENK